MISGQENHGKTAVKNQNPNGGCHERPHWIGKVHPNTVRFLGTKTTRPWIVIVRIFVIVHFIILVCTRQGTRATPAAGNEIAAHSSDGSGTAITLVIITQISLIIDRIVTTRKSLSIPIEKEIVSKRIMGSFKADQADKKRCDKSIHS